MPLRGFGAVVGGARGERDRDGHHRAVYVRGGMHSMDIDSVEVERLQCEATPAMALKKHVMPSETPAPVPPPLPGVPPEGPRWSPSTSISPRQPPAESRP